MLGDWLKRVKTVQDLPELFGQLGYSKAWAPYVEDGVTVANWKGFHVIAGAGPDSHDVARQLARKVGQTGSPALVVGVKLAEELSLASPRQGTAGVNRCIRISLRNPTVDSLALLDRLRPLPGTNALEHSLRVDETLTSETVSERFYARFRQVHHGMRESLASVTVHADRDMIALLALIRVLFLYFVQAKGWLNHQPDFLRVHFDVEVAAGRHFHRGFLDTLFFKTLNTPVKARKRSLNVPYLNGGLFEKHSVETRWPDTSFCNSMWHSAFEDLFDRFRFCVAEARQADAIAPDMLGRVFERVMAPHIRHSTGTYYTPETIVRRIIGLCLQSSIVTLGALDPKDAERVVSGTAVSTPVAAAAEVALTRIRLLDPAAGSGAFLLSALDLIAHARASLARSTSNDVDVVTIRKQILRNNLFGVDLNPVAVKLAELRLWLAVIAEDPTQEIERVAPLPNLDGVVRQGDSLIDPVSAVASLRSSGSAHEAVAKVERARKALFESRHDRRAPAMARLRRAELRVAEQSLTRSIDLTTHAIRDLTAQARGRDLFGKRSGLIASNQVHYKRLKENRRASRKALLAVREGTLPFFSYEVHTPDVMREGGFTTVVGNPPWIRAERLAPSRRETLKRRFTWWRASGGPGFKHLPDLSVAFFQRALELTRPGGTCGFLLPSKIVTAAYGEYARRQMVTTVTVDYAYRLPRRDAERFAASIYPMAVLARKQPPPDTHVVRLDLSGENTVKQRSLDRTGPWVLVSTSVQMAIDAMMRCGRPLRTVAPAMLGVKTGANHIFVGTLTREKRSCVTLMFRESEWTFPRHYVRPVLRGRDVGPFVARTEKWIVWCHDRTGAARRTVSNTVSEYFTLHRKQLRRRIDDTGGPLWSVFRVAAAQHGNRVVWPDIVKRPCAIVLDHASDQFVPLNTCYVSTTRDRATSHLIAAMMNSRWTAVLVQLHADEARGGYRRMNARVANILPIPHPNSRSGTLSEMSRAAHEGEQINQQALDDAVAECLDIPSSSRRALETFYHDHCS